MQKICPKCNKEAEFSTAEFKRVSGWCKFCKNKWYLDNKERILLNQHNRYVNNKETTLDKQKEYYQNNLHTKLTYAKNYRSSHKEKASEYSKEYRLNNKEELALYRAEYEKKRRLTDIEYRIKNSVSISVNSFLKRLGYSKKGKSIEKFLTYTVNDLKFHLEKQFEPWMTWNNWGRYNNKIWKENDQSTWTWQIDHIIPHSTFHYTSIKDDEFKKCWSLSNLRPYSAKQNILDNARRAGGVI